MNPRAAALEKFIADLATIPSDVAGPHATNPWRDTCPVMDAVPEAPRGRRERLAAHLGSPDIQVILLGEAAGYQGCRYSGMTFTSERLLLEGAIPGIPAPVFRLTHRPRPFSEPSATIVWGALKDLGLERRVALWNAFPFHPHKPGEVLSNRTPTRAELQFGAGILRRLLDEVLPPGVRLVAVGGKAAETLRGLGFAIPEGYAIRHPAMGGANEFREGMAALFGR